MKDWVEKGNPGLPWMVLVAILSCSVLLDAQQMETSKKDTFLGKLARVAAIGGETTGWALELVSEREVGGRKVRSIELDPHGVRLDPLTGKQVEATGVLRQREGVERKRYWVLVVETIQEQSTPGDPRLRQSRPNPPGQ